MKAVILAGGKGTRLAEETQVKPKPLVEIGGRPILWHIMKTYSQYGINDFIICLGYKGYLIKEYFQNYFLHMSNVTFDLGGNSIEYHDRRSEPWKVTLIDTGLETMTGGRIKRIAKYLQDEDRFLMTYGDGVANVDIQKLITQHKTTGARATLTSVIQPGRFGALKYLDNNRIAKFTEKPSEETSRINGGYFVLETSVLDLIVSDDTIWEREPLETLANNGELYSFNHDGFWHPMDMLRDKNYLEGLWKAETAPWKIW